MEKEFDQIVARWQGKVEMVKRGIEEEQKLARGKVAAEIAERLVAQVQEKNRQAVEIQKVKEEVETQIASTGFSKNSEETKAEIEKMQKELDELLGQYERVISDKLQLFSDLL